MEASGAEGGPRSVGTGHDQERECGTRAGPRGTNGHMDHTWPRSPRAIVPLLAQLMLTVAEAEQFAIRQALARYPVRTARAGTLPAMLVLLAVLGFPILGYQGPAGDGSCSAGVERSGAEPLTSPVPMDSSSVPLVPILSRYEVLAVYDVLPIGSDRADYSGITVVGADSSGVTLWLADDKALRLEDAIYALRVDLPKGRPDQITSLEPARIKVENEHGVPTSDDIEDIGWLPPTATAPGLLAASGERGPGDAPVSWFYLLVPEGQGLRLSRSGIASPPGESVENDGMEAVALRRAAGDRVELYLFKERPAPSYARLFVLEPDAFGYRPVPDSSGTLFSTPAFQTQSGAAFRPGGKTVSVIDRQRRLIGLVQPFLDRPGLESKPREWINYAAIDALLEGRDSGTSPSLFGVLEGIAEDTFGRLYLLADNNEVRHSRLVVLRSTKPRDSLKAPE